MQPGIDEKFYLVDVTDEMLAFIERADQLCASLSYDECITAALFPTYLRRGQVLLVEELASLLYEARAFDASVPRDGEDYVLLAEIALHELFPSLTRVLDGSEERVIGLKVTGIGNARRVYQGVFETIPKHQIM